MNKQNSSVNPIVLDYLYKKDIYNYLQIIVLRAKGHLCSQKLFGRDKCNFRNLNFLRIRTLFTWFHTYTFISDLMQQYRDQIVTKKHFIDKHGQYFAYSLDRT